MYRQTDKYCQGLIDSISSWYYTVQPLIVKDILYQGHNTKKIYIHMYTGLPRAYRLQRRKGHVTTIYSHRINKIQTSCRTVLFFSNFSYLSATAYTDFVTSFSLGLYFDRYMYLYKLLVLFSGTSDIGHSKKLYIKDKFSCQNDYFL